MLHNVASFGRLEAMLTDFPNRTSGVSLTWRPFLDDDIILYDKSAHEEEITLDLKDEMEALHFRMPSLSGQDTKKLQLTALQEVRDNAVGAYKSLLDRANIVKIMIHQQGGGTKNNRISIYAYSGEEQKPAAMTSASLLL